MNCRCVEHFLLNFGSLLNHASMAAKETNRMGVINDLSKQGKFHLGVNKLLHKWTVFLKCCSAGLVNLGRWRHTRQNILFAGELNGFFLSERLQKCQWAAKFCVMTNTAERHITMCLSDILTLYREHGFYCLNSAAKNEPEPIVKDVSHVMFYSTVTIFLRITYVFPILLAKTVDLMRLLVCKL